MTAPEKPSASPLQFDAAEPSAAAAGGMTCATCKKPLSGSYHMLNKLMICASCRGRLEREWRGGWGGARFLKATLYGLGGAAVGAAIWYAVLAITDMQIGLIAIVVGFLVGKAVAKGSGGRGGWQYQTLAVVLTYLAIVSTYIPFIIKGFRDHRTGTAVTADSTARARAPAPADSALAAGDSAAPVASADSAAPVRHAGAARKPLTLGGFVLGIGALLVIAMIAPFFAGVSNIIGILIIGFALYEAWKFNKKPKIEFSGPFQVGAPAP